MKIYQSCLLAIVMALTFTTCKNEDNTTSPTLGTADINGAVKDAITQAPVAGVTVSATSLAGGAQLKTTDANGAFVLEFKFDSLTTVTITMSKQNYRDTTFTIQVRAGNQVSLYVYLVSTIPAGPGKISGVVKDATTGSPLANVKIRARSVQIDPESTITDAAGKYSLSFPVDSSLQQTTVPVNLFLKQPGYRDTTIVVTVRFGMETTMPIRLLPKTAAVIEGVVTDLATGQVLDGVKVSAQGATVAQQSTTTDLLGRYSLAFPIDSAAIVVASFSKTGYRDTSKVLEISGGATTELAFAMRQSAGGGGTAGGSGIAQTIAFLGADPQEVSVYGVGGKETSTLAWEVRDSLGLPIDGAHAVSLTFTSLSGPNGGEYVSPPVLMTNSSGKASTTFNSGTRSGVVQVVASTTVAGRTIQSSPVRIIINGGFPVQARFSIAATNYNFPGRDWQGRTLPVTILAGDIYSNPVAPSTAVYFRSSAGVIQPSVFTDKNGQGTVNLISGNPLPRGIYGAPGIADSGYHYVVAKTLGQNGVTVTDSILVLWSGRSMITQVSADTFNISNGGSQLFTFRVSDSWGHPLAAGTRITVIGTVPPPPSAGTPVNQIQLGFGVSGSVTLEDRIFPGPGTTQFSFILSDGTTGITDLTAVVITISVDGPNGTASYVINGTVR